MQKILVTGAHGIGIDGIATIAYRWGCEISKDEIIYDYIMPKGFTEERYLEEISRVGGTVLAPQAPLRGLKKYWWIYSQMKKYEGCILHINQDRSYIALVYEVLGRLGGIRSLVVHSHNSSLDVADPVKRAIMVTAHYLCRPVVCALATRMCACSDRAAEWMFGHRNVRKGRITEITNGVDLIGSRYQKEIREKYRKELDLTDDMITVICVGRLSYQKNYPFLLRSFKELIIAEPKARLLIVGTGAEEEAIKKKIESLGLTDKVRLLGKRTDVPSLLCAADVFALPSRFEGLPLVLVEAQAAALPCVVSKEITREVAITDRVRFIGTDDPKEWAVEIMAAACGDREHTDMRGVERFSLSVSCEQLKKLYKSME